MSSRHLFCVMFTGLWQTQRPVSIEYRFRTRKYNNFVDRLSGARYIAPVAISVSMTNMSFPSTAVPAPHPGLELGQGSRGQHNLHL